MTCPTAPFRDPFSAELPRGHLSNIGQTLAWTFSSAQLLCEGVIFSQIFDVKDQPCRAEVFFSQRTNEVKFSLHLIGPLTEKLHATFDVKVYTPEKKRMIGHQTLKVAFDPMQPTADLEFLLTRASLNKYPAIVVLIDSFTSLARDSSLAPLWNCASTSDVIILSTLPDGTTAPIVYIHKSIVMTTIPGILRLVKVVDQGSAENNNRRDDENDRKMVDVDDKDDDRSESDSAYSGQSGSIEREQNGKNTEPKPRALFNEAKSKATLPPSYSSSTTRSNTSRLTAYIHTSLHSALATRPDREIWLWPPHLPAQFCYRIMHWIYLKKLLPPPPFNQYHSLDMTSFNPFMDLLLELNQLQHFQEYALLTAAAISRHSDMVSLCQYHEFSESHARRFLRRPLQEAMHRRWNEIVGPSPTNEALLRLLQTDRTGIVAGFLRGSSIGRGDGLF